MLSIACAILLDLGPGLGRNLSVLVGMRMDLGRWKSLVSYCLFLTRARRLFELERRGKRLEIRCSMLS